MPGPEQQGISYSRLGPMDPNRVRYELAGEISPPAAPTAPAPTVPQGAPRARSRRRLRRLRHRGTAGRRE